MNEAGSRIDGPLSIPARIAEGHKGTFGTTLVIGGAITPRIMAGAPSLAARGALRSGCGLTVVAAPRSIATVVTELIPESTVLPLDVGDEVHPETAERCLEAVRDAHAVVCGCGLGSPDGVEAMVEAIADCEERPRVLDADALNALAGAGPRTMRGPVVLTPHPGEWGRLARSVGIDGDPFEDERRPLAAAALARRLDSGGGPVVVVLKGARTVVSDGERWWRCDRTNPALATGGSGDVLAGVIGGLLAQFHPRAGAPASRFTRDAFDLACIGVELHSLAGRAWSSLHGDAGLLAGELADSIPDARRLLQSRHA